MYTSKTNGHGQSISYDCLTQVSPFPPFSFLHISKVVVPIYITIGICVYACLKYPTRLVLHPSMLAWMYTWYLYMFSIIICDGITCIYTTLKMIFSDVTTLPCSTLILNSLTISIRRYARRCDGILLLSLLYYFFPYPY